MDKDKKEDKKEEKKLQVSRRTFLSASAAVGVVAGCGLPIDPEELEEGAEEDPADSLSQAVVPTGLVGVAKNTRIATAVSQAIANCGGLPFNPSGKRVMIKVCVNRGNPIPCSTSPQVVLALVNYLKNRGATSILVGDHSNDVTNAKAAMKRAGIWDAVSGRSRVTCVDFQCANTKCTRGANCPRTRTVSCPDFQPKPYRLVRPAGATNWPNGFNITTYFDEVDHVINVCRIADHCYANYTMVFKAWYGVLASADRQYGHGTSPYLALQKRLPELHLAKKEDFVIIDGSKVLLWGGPDNLTPAAAVTCNTVVASRNLGAADLTGLAILKARLQMANKINTKISNTKGWNQAQQVRARQLGLSITRQSDYTWATTGLSAAEANLYWGFIKE